MKNLNVSRYIKANFKGNIVGQCIDADNKKLLLIAEDLSVYDISNNRLQKIEHNFNLTAIIEKIKHDEVILNEYIVETGCILIALRCGSIIKLAVSSFGQQSCRIYEHDVEIASVKLSPSQDLIALADSNNKLLILTPDLTECLCQDDALLQNESIHKPVGVGWGSKETQFFGLDGRPSKEKESKNKIILSEEEVHVIDAIESDELFKRFEKERERSTVIDWRGDGQLLASLTFIPDTNKHYLKVWNRNLELQYMSEQLVTMERGLLCWIPNGQYVCCAQRRDRRVNEIAMFEKNGMIHQRITLPTDLDNLYFREISWSSDSSILAIIAVRFGILPDSSVFKRHMLMLYTMQNFHYYLKYCTQLSAPSSDKDEIYSLRWNLTNSSILYVWSTKGQCFEFDCKHVIEYSSEKSLVAVQDANKILLTPLNICNVPPPMCAVQLKLPQVVSKIILNPQSDHSIYIFTLDDILYYPGAPKSDIEIVSCVTNKAVQDFASKLSNFDTVNIPSANEYQNVTYFKDKILLASKQKIGQNELVQIEIHENEAGNNFAEKLITSTGDRWIVAITSSCGASSCDDAKICFITDNWECTILRVADGTSSAKFDLQALTNDRPQLLKVELIHDNYTENDEGCRLISIDRDLTLRINDNILISNSCTSFRTSKNFLIYTTTENTLNIVPIKNVFSKQGNEPLECWNQSIEIGGILVTVSEHDSKVVLQMPRGNLEILHPRIMVLLEIINHLNQGQYGLAMKLARRHRVDSNFICDYLIRNGNSANLPTRLIDFSNQVSDCDPSLLNIFITELRQEDTMNERYKNAVDFIHDLADWQIDRGIQVNDKVQLICSSFDWNGQAKFIQPQLLSLLKQTPRRADEALRIIYNLEQEEKEAALKFIAYFVDIDKLFFDALSTHDTDIALMVAGFSSKDPKEYLVLLDNFNAIKQTNLRNYKIDLHIKNYESAFVNALYYLRALYRDEPIDQISIDDFEKELIKMVVSKRLYKYAVKTCIENYNGFSDSLSGFFSEIWSNYADYLLEKRHYLEASLVYLDSINHNLPDGTKLERVNNALKCLMLESDWERSFALIQRYSSILTNREDLLAKLSDSLMLQGKVSESAVVINPTRCQTVASGMSLRGKWHLAEALAPQEHSFDSFVAELKQSINDEIDRLVSVAQEDLDTATSQYDRLKVLIQTQSQQTRAVIGLVDSENCLLADGLSTVDGSEVSSVTCGSAKLGGQGAKVARSGAASIRTRASSSKSSKSSAERGKKIQLKKGSRFEDVALAMELKKFVDKQKSLQEQARHVQATEAYFFRSLLSQNHSMKRLNELVVRSYELAIEVCKNFWPRGHEAQTESAFSLYKRFVKRLHSEEVFENVDFEVLIAPEPAKLANQLELL